MGVATEERALMRQRLELWEQQQHSSSSSLALKVRVSMWMLCVHVGESSVCCLVSSRRKGAARSWPFFFNMLVPCPCPEYYKFNLCPLFCRRWRRM